MSPRRTMDSLCLWGSGGWTGGREQTASSEKSPQPQQVTGPPTPSLGMMQPRALSLRICPGAANGGHCAPLLLGGHVTVLLAHCTERGRVVKPPRCTSDHAALDELD